MGEGPQQRLRDRGPHPQRAEEVDVPGVHLHGQRRHLQAAAEGVSHLHGGVVCHRRHRRHRQKTRKLAPACRTTLTTRGFVAAAALRNKA